MAPPDDKRASKAFVARPRSEEILQIYEMDPRQASKMVVVRTTTARTKIEISLTGRCNIKIGRFNSPFRLGLLMFASPLPARCSRKNLAGSMIRTYTRINPITVRQI